MHLIFSPCFRYKGPKFSTKTQMVNYSELEISLAEKNLEKLFQRHPKNLSKCLDKKSLVVFKCNCPYVTKLEKKSQSAHLSISHFFRQKTFRNDSDLECKLVDERLLCLFLPSGILGHFQANL